jgi:CDP-4-dehydro-6-deoxyglucose reductase, E1
MVMEVNMIKHTLMENNITKEDIKVLIKFLKKKPILTQSKNVIKFEKKWSKWLGCKYSVFVNSGSSANLITISCLKYFNKSKIRNEIIVPALTWSSDVNSVILNGFKPVFVDVNKQTLSMDLNQVMKMINKKTLAVFITHAQGFNGINKEFVDFLKKKKIHLIEDVCESHGATLNGKKVGTFGEMSNFSFYYAHHMTTIEGGMVSTNNKDFYQILRSLRSHGLLREMNEKKKINFYKKKYSDLNEQFIFLHPAYNVRNTELGAVIGLNQLKNLNKNIKLRNSNFNYFLKNINEKKFQTNFELKGMSNYAFPLILKDPSFVKRNKLEKIMKKFKIEFRRGNAGGGNQLRQPYVKNYLKNKINLKNFNNVEHIHHFGYYIGNFPSLKKNKIKKICEILNKI